MHVRYASEYQRLSVKGRFPADHNIFGPFLQTRPTTEGGLTQPATSTVWNDQPSDFYEWMNSAFFVTTKNVYCVLCGETVRDIASHFEYGPSHGEKWRKSLLTKGALTAQDALALIYFLVFKGEQAGPALSGDEFLGFCGIMQKYPTMDYVVPGPDYALDLKLIRTFTQRVYGWATGLSPQALRACVESSR
jgi:hypothetical protein